MIRPALLATALLATALLAMGSLASLAPASAETVVKGPDGLSVNCDDFRFVANGTVETSREATLVYPDKKGSFSEASFGPRTFSSGGVDLGEWIIKSCKK